MKIAPIRNLNINFASKHIDVRKADDLMRSTQNKFPTFCPSYADFFYKSLDADSFEKIYYRDKFVDGIATKFIENVRKPTDAVEDTSKPPFAYQFLLDTVKEYKMANCKEASNLMLCALYANGYYKSQVVNLAFDYCAKDKKTGKIVYRGNHHIDHCFALTTMNNDKRIDENNAIVIDSWLNYCADSKEAKGKYKALFAKDIDKFVKADLKEEGIDINDVDINISPYYYFSTNHDEQTAKAIANSVLLKYGNLRQTKSSK